MIKAYYNKGLTLIEVVISMFIVAFILVGMLRLYSLGNIQLEIVRHKMMAVNLAQAEIENLKNSGYENIVLANYPLNQTVKIDRGRTNDLSDDINGTMLTEVLVVVEGYKIIVTVTWADYYGMINDVLESMVTPYL